MCMLERYEEELQSVTQQARSDSKLAESDSEASRLRLLAFHSECTDLQSAIREAVSLEEQERACLEAQRLAQAETIKELAAYKSRTQRLQDAADLRAEVDLENAEEVAAARATAARNGQAATELRAQLASTRKELAHHRHASRELAQTSENLEAAQLKMKRAQRTREALDAELETSRSRQEFLEKQLRLLQTRMTAQRLAACDSHGAGRFASGADSLVFCDGILFTAGSRGSSRPPSGRVSADGKRDNKEAGVDLKHRLHSEVIKPDSCEVATPGMGRSRSAGCFKLSSDDASGGSAQSLHYSRSASAREHEDFGKNPVPPKFPAQLAPLGPLVHVPNTIVSTPPRPPQSDGACAGSLLPSTLRHSSSATPSGS